MYVCHRHPAAPSGRISIGRIEESGVQGWGFGGLKSGEGLACTDLMGEKWLRTRMWLVPTSPKLEIHSPAHSQISRS